MRARAGSRNSKLARFLQVALAFRRLTGAEGAGATGEQQAGRLAGTVEIEASKESVGILPLTHPGSTGGWMTTTTEHDDGIGLGGFQGGAALPGGLQPAPETLAHQPEGEDPEQR